MSNPHLEALYMVRAIAEEARETDDPGQLYKDLLSIFLLSNTAIEDNRLDD